MTIEEKTGLGFMQKLLKKSSQIDYFNLRGFLFCCAPDGARFQWVQVPNPSGSETDIADGKGVYREVESEGSWMWGTY